MTGSELLDVIFEADSHNGSYMSLREWLKSLLATLWEEGEGFSGKRPFGDSGWDWQLYADLANASPQFRETINARYYDEEMEDFDEAKAEELISDAIANL